MDFIHGYNMYHSYIIGASPTLITTTENAVPMYVPSCVYVVMNEVHMHAHHLIGHINLIPAQKARLPVSPCTSIFHSKNGAWPQMKYMGQVLTSPLTIRKSL